MENTPEINRFTVEEQGRQIEVFIPKSGDKSYDDYLEVAEREKTREQIRNLPPKHVAKLPRSERIEAVREINNFRKRRQSEYPKRYF